MVQERSRDIVGEHCEMSRRLSRELIERHGIVESRKNAMWMPAGWYDIVDSLFTRMRELGWDGRLTQLKSKWCCLRVYVDTEDSAVLDAIADAERRSMGTCERCGRPHGLRTPRGGHAWCEVCESELTNSEG